MARESYESRQRRAARKGDPEEGARWAMGVQDFLREHGVKTIVLGDETCQALGLTEARLRKLCGASGGFAFLTMSTVWRDVEPTAHVPSGKAFVRYEWKVSL